MTSPDYCILCLQRESTDSHLVIKHRMPGSPIKSLHPTLVERMLFNYARDEFPDWRLVCYEPLHGEDISGLASEYLERKYGKIGWPTEINPAPEEDDEWPDAPQI